MSVFFLIMIKLIVVHIKRQVKHYINYIYVKLVDCTYCFKFFVVFIV
jgi:hypothetical protein